MNTIRRSTETAKGPKEGQTIVWRFKGNHGWKKGYVREILARGKVIEVSATLADDIVAVADIEWHPA